MAAYDRWSYSAAGLQQITFAETRLHKENVLKVAEKLRKKTLPLGLAVAYDEKCRRHWAERVAKRDHSFSLSAAVSKVDEDRHSRARVVSRHSSCARA